MERRKTHEMTDSFKAKQLFIAAAFTLYANSDAKMKKRSLFLWQMIVYYYLLRTFVRIREI